MRDDCGARRELTAAYFLGLHGKRGASASRAAFALMSRRAAALFFFPVQHCFKTLSLPLKCGFVAIISTVPQIIGHLLKQYVRNKTLRAALFWEIN